MMQTYDMNELKEVLLNVGITLAKNGSNSLEMEIPFNNQIGIIEVKIRMKFIEVR